MTRRGAPTFEDAPHVAVRVSGARAGVDGEAVLVLEVAVDEAPHVRARRHVLRAQLVAVRDAVIHSVHGLCVVCRSFVHALAGHHEPSMTGQSAGWWVANWGRRERAVASSRQPRCHACLHAFAAGPVLDVVNLEVDELEHARLIEGDGVQRQGVLLAIASQRRAIRLDGHLRRHCRGCQGDEANEGREKLELHFGSPAVTWGQRLLLVQRQAPAGMYSSRHDVQRLRTPKICGQVSPGTRHLMWSGVGKRRRPLRSI